MQGSDPGRAGRGATGSASGQHRLATAYARLEPWMHCGIVHAGSVSAYCGRSLGKPEQVVLHPPAEKKRMQQMKARHHPLECQGRVARRGAGSLGPGLEFE